MLHEGTTGPWISVDPGHCMHVKSDKKDFVDVDAHLIMPDYILECGPSSITTKLSNMKQIYGNFVSPEQEIIY